MISKKNEMINEIMFSNVQEDTLKIVIKDDLFEIKDYLNKLSIKKLFENHKSSVFKRNAILVTKEYLKEYDFDENIFKLFLLFTINQSRSILNQIKTLKVDQKIFETCVDYSKKYVELSIKDKDELKIFISTYRRIKKVFKFLDTSNLKVTNKINEKNLLVKLIRKDKTLIHDFTILYDIRKMNSTEIERIAKMIIQILGTNDAFDVSLKNIEEKSNIDGVILSFFIINLLNRCYKTTLHIRKEIEKMDDETIDMIMKIGEKTIKDYYSYLDKLYYLSAYNGDKELPILLLIKQRYQRKILSDSIDNFIK